MLPRWQQFLATHYAAYRFPEYGLFMALSYAQREALSDVVAGPLLFQGLEKDRHSRRTSRSMAWHSKHALPNA